MAVNVFSNHFAMLPATLLRLQEFPLACSRVSPTSQPPQFHPIISFQNPKSRFLSQPSLTRQLFSSVQFVTSVQWSPSHSNSCSCFNSSTTCSQVHGLTQHAMAQRRLFLLKVAGSSPSDLATHKRPHRNAPPPSSATLAPNPNFRQVLPSLTPRRSQWGNNRNGGKAPQRNP